jgi:hypothetical protein
MNRSPLIVAGVTAIFAGPAVADPYPRAGWHAELTTYSHAVAGTVTILDEDTIRLDPFYYDGGGISVYVYLAAEETNESFKGGLQAGPQLLGMVFDGGSLTVDLPEGATLDGYHAVSIWCVAAGANFGSGTFVCPADFDGNGALEIDDFVSFQTAFAVGLERADFDLDGSLTIDDFIAFQTAFAVGCR